MESLMHLIIPDIKDFVTNSICSIQHLTRIKYLINSTNGPISPETKLLGKGTGWQTKQAGDSRDRETGWHKRKGTKNGWQKERMGWEIIRYLVWASWQRCSAIRPLPRHGCCLSLHSSRTRGLCPQHFRTCFMPPRSYKNRGESIQRKPRDQNNGKEEKIKNSINPFCKK